MKCSRALIDKAFAELGGRRVTVTTPCERRARWRVVEAVSATSCRSARRSIEGGEEGDARVTARATEADTHLGWTDSGSSGSPPTIRNPRAAHRGVRMARAGRAVSEGACRARPRRLEDRRPEDEVGEADAEVGHDHAPAGGGRPSTIASPSVAGSG